MELKFDELQGLRPALERIAAALEALAGNSSVSAKPENTDPATGSVDADLCEDVEEKPKKKKAAPKKSADSSNQGEELTEPIMRKFAAEAVKKGLKTTAKIIKEITGGETRFADIDPSLYGEIHQAIRAGLAKLEADE